MLILILILIDPSRIFLGSGQVCFVEHQNKNKIRFRPVFPFFFSYSCSQKRSRTVALASERIIHLNNSKNNWKLYSWDADKHLRLSGRLRRALPKRSSSATAVVSCRRVNSELLAVFLSISLALASSRNPLQHRPRLLLTPPLAASQ